MKPTLLFATLSMVFAVPQVFAATELETLRARCTEQERQIRQLEDQVQKLKSGTGGQSAAVVKTASVSSATPSASAIHTVRPGECLAGIARRAGCSSASLAKANGLKTSSMIHPGQKLKLPGTATAQAQPAQAPATRTAVPSTAPLAGKTHKIKAGETFSSISRKNRVSIETLVAANPGVKPTALRPGQVIRLSPGTPVSAPASAPAPQVKQAGHLASTPAAPRTPAPTSTPVVAEKRRETPAPLAASAPPVSAPATSEKKAESPAAPAIPNPEKKIRSVMIEGEMTYGEFAATHGTDTSRLNDLNGLDLTNATVLAKGSELYVPAQP